MILNRNICTHRNARNACPLNSIVSQFSRDSARWCVCVCAVLCTSLSVLLLGNISGCLGFGQPEVYIVPSYYYYFFLLSRRSDAHFLHQTERHNRPISAHNHHFTLIRMDIFFQAKRSRSRSYGKPPISSTFISNIGSPLSDARRRHHRASSTVLVCCAFVSNKYA